ncbi:MAG TPA: hypothetical protein VLT36_10510, partial [Candidatus Dormibacteraeota bacterium]|nr:hypothetical protein [Candidatus Dormibacteraeota bacterium]
MKKILLTLASVFVASASFAAIPVYDPFADATASGGTSYALGAAGWHQTNSVGDPWFEINTAASAATQIIITNGLGTISGLPAAAGNAIGLRNVAGPGMRVSVGTAIPETSNGTKVYYSMVVQVNNVS